MPRRLLTRLLHLCLALTVVMQFAAPVADTAGRYCRHGDQAFLMAAQNGVRAHHWPFGDMPPVEWLTVSDLGNILANIRARRRAYGIE